MLFALTVALLPLKKLITFYMYILSAVLLLGAHYMSFLYVEMEKTSPIVNCILDEAECVRRLGINLAVQGVISAVVGYLVGLKSWTKFTLLSYTLPMFARLASFPVEDLHRVHNFAAVFTLLLVVFFLFNQVPLVLDLLKAALNEVSASVQVYGWVAYLVMIWFQILLPVQFLIFWLVLFALQLHKYLGVPNHPILAEGWLVVLLASIGESCVTPFSLIGVCITVSYTSHVILTLTKLYLQGRDAFLNDNVMHRGWTEGFTMFLLAMQTGIIELKSTQRAFLMSIVLFIVISSLIQSMYEITDPLLLALGASQNRSILKHVRAVALCTFLWMFPLFMTYTICQFFDLDFWLMAVISSCVLTSVQVIGSLVVYALFIYEGLRVTPWESLDDVVYYAKATTRVLEFLVAVFFVCYGIKESLVGEWSWVNSSIQIIHCYFNVWHRLQAGWQSYLRRREAASKIESLPAATPEQLAEHNDVCAICFQIMDSARITRCSHYFHGMCLRKWLYVQDKCPMCHTKISRAREDEEQAEEPAQPANQPPAGLADIIAPAAPAGEAFPGQGHLADPQFQGQGHAVGAAPDITRNSVAAPIEEPRPRGRPDGGSGDLPGRDSQEPLPDFVLDTVDSGGDRDRGHPGGHTLRSLGTRPENNSGQPGPNQQ